MTKEIWLNLPVKDIKKSKEFFMHLGFSLNSKYGNSDDSACFLIGNNNFVLMLFSETTFKTFTRNPITDTTKSTEVLISIDAENREEVDEMAKKAEQGGGIVYAAPGEKDGWLYGCGFSDLDGHRWNVLYMDMSKMPPR